VRDTYDLHITCESYFVCVYLIGEVVVDNDVNSLDVNATAEEVGGHQDALVELLEGEEERECVCVWGGEQESQLDLLYAVRHDCC
jgi:hypothetical protein